MGILDSGARRYLLRTAADDEPSTTTMQKPAAAMTETELKHVLPRSFSSCNLVRAARLRDAVAGDFREGREPCLATMHTRTVALFATGRHGEALRRQMERQLLEADMQAELERRQLLNWCPQACRLYALKTPGDGNCLVHAASLAMWALTDSECAVRGAMHAALCQPSAAALYRRRWMGSRATADGAEELGFRYSTRDWEEEWSKVLEMSRPVEQLSRDGFRFRSLEEIHIFVLANVLRRPIIIVSDVVLRSVASGSTLAPLNISGIYLPLTWSASVCYRYPLVLGFHNGHFAPLVCMQDDPAGEERRARVLPLVDRHRAALPVQFLLPEEEPQRLLLLQQYLRTEEVALPGQGASAPVLVASLPPAPNAGDDPDLVSDYLEVVERRFRAPAIRGPPAPAPRAVPAAAPPGDEAMYSATTERCSSPGCTYLRSVHTGAFCHECFDRLRGGAGVGAGVASPSPAPGPAAPEARPQAQRGAEREAAWEERCSAPPDVLPSAPEISPPPLLSAETSGMKCSSPTCPFTGDRELAGLCQNCFHLREGRRSARVEAGAGGAGAASPAAAPGLPWPRGQNEAGAAGAADAPCCGCGEGRALGSIALCRACVDKPSLAPPARAAAPVSRPAGGDGSEVAAAATGARSDKCKTPGCEFFGTPEKESYCTICFLQYLENAAYETERRGTTADPPRDRPVSSTAAAAGSPRPDGRPRCLRAACPQPGKPELDGFCTDCYVARASEPEQWEPARGELRAAASPACVTPSCPSPAAPGGPLCADCRRRNAELRHTHPQRQHRRQATTAPTPGGGGGAERRRRGGSTAPAGLRDACRAPGCEHFGNAGCDGYCNECHAMIQLYGR